MWGFGENNLYENMAIDSPTIRRWQQRIQRALTFAPLLVAGRGVFSYTGGLMPRRRPITVRARPASPRFHSRPSPDAAI